MKHVPGKTLALKTMSTVFKLHGSLTFLKNNVNVNNNHNILDVLSFSCPLLLN